MKNAYVLITPVYNEEQFVEQVIECVIAQTVLPAKWLIIDDGSTDRSGEIVKGYAAEYEFIEYYPLQRSNIQTYYSRRVESLLLGIEHVRDMSYDFLAILDADLTLGTTYYESILREFERNPKLGIASGAYVNSVGGRPQKVLRDSDSISTPGGLQVFRRECYESIGGHAPLRYGGSDAMVGILARMNGWETRCFPEHEAVHYRPTGVWEGNSVLKARFRQGMQEYDLGTHPVFMVAKSVRRAILEKPYLLGSAARFLGFINLSFRRAERGISDDAVSYVRKEQFGRMFSSFRRKRYLNRGSKPDISACIAENAPLVKRDFILISPVYNEEDFIEQLIQSVVAQTIRPNKWIIVDDGSTDSTHEIIEEYQGRYDFILCHRKKRENVKSYYYNKIEAFLTGYDIIKHVAHDFVACLDADLTLGPTYYEDVLREFEKDSKLGIASGVYVNWINGQRQSVIRDNISTPGGLQVFRRECYEFIGGYKPLLYGGEDAIADVMVRRGGWRTRSFPKYETMHHRYIGVRGGISVLKGKFTQGLAEYHLGTHPIFMLAKSLRRVFIEKPYISASIARLLGFILGCLRRDDRDISDEIRKYVQKEQLNRLFWWRRFGNR